MKEQKFDVKVKRVYAYCDCGNVMTKIITERGEGNKVYRYCYECDKCKKVEWVLIDYPHIEVEYENGYAEKIRIGDKL